MKSKRPLRDYQEAAIAKYINGDSAFFHMQMRLGKTLTCIRWLDRMAISPRKILIVAPKTVLIAWEIELAEEEKAFVNMTGYKLKDRHAYMDEPGEGYSLCNYETISSLNEKTGYRLLANFDAVVLDESICIKNPNAKATKILLKASPHISVRACLTGLANPESWLDVWPQIAFANGGNWMGFDNFYKWRDCFFQNFGFDWELPDFNSVKIKKAFHEDVYVMTRKQAGIRDVKIRQIRSGEMGHHERRIYDSIEAKWALPCSPGEEVNDKDQAELAISDPEEAKYKLVVISWLRRVCGGVLPLKPITYIPTWKLDETIHIVTKELPGESVVVWFAYNAEISLVYAALKREGVRCSWITGSTSQEERRDRIKGFQDKKIQVILVQQKCGQYGIDLSAADTAIYYSCDYSYNLRAQSEERIFKVGKPNDLLIIDLITKDSVDETIAETIQGKKSDASLLLARLGSFPKSKARSNS
jgi:SNF2 family DNA or RNA helicase